MLNRSRSLTSLVFSVFFTLHMGACSSQEASTEETIQPTEDQAAAEPTETDKALAEASSSDFTEPTDVQLNGDTSPVVTDAPVVAETDTETTTPVEAVDNTVTPPALPDLTAETAEASSSVNANVAVYFAKSSSRISREFRAQLKEVAAKLKADRSIKISLSGHCDNRGSASFNRKLAMKRARAVKNALVKMGVKGKQIVLGSPQLASSGSTEEEHRQNRRVEVEFQ